MMWLLLQFVMWLREMKREMEREEGLGGGGERERGMLILSP
jgi:hypothetical protein